MWTKRKCPGQTQTRIELARFSHVEVALISSFRVSTFCYVEISSSAFTLVFAL